jgi:hypothetical protein
MYDVEEVARRRARGLVPLLMLCALTWTLAMWKIVDYFSHLDPFRGGDSGGLTGAFLLMLGTYAATAAVWVAWFKVLYVRVVDARRARFPRSAWLWAWLPFVNLVVPKMLVNDVWRAGDHPARPSRAPWQVQAWWVLWVLWAVPNGSKPLQGLLGHVDLPYDVGVRVVLGGVTALMVLHAAFAIATVWILTRRIADVIPAMPPEPVPSWPDRVGAT